MKYITYESGSHTTAIVFNASVGHDDMARILKNSNCTILGAGKFHLDQMEEKITIYEGSVSLKMEPSSSDERILRNLFFPPF